MFRSGRCFVVQSLITTPAMDHIPFGDVLVCWYLSICLSGFTPVNLTFANWGT
jgi:hypothetical protein